MGKSPDIQLASGFDSGQLGLGLDRHELRTSDSFTESVLWVDGTGVCSMTLMH